MIKKLLKVWLAKLWVNYADIIILTVVSEKYKYVLVGIDEDTVTAKLFSWNDSLP